MLKKITHVTLLVNDLYEALEFYKKLGFKMHTDAMFENMHWLTLYLDGQSESELILILPQSDAEKALVGKQAGDKAIISFESSDCNEDYEKLSKAGIEFSKKPENLPWGISAIFSDLYGNNIYICQQNTYR